MSESGDAPVMPPRVFPWRTVLTAAAGILGLGLAFSLQARDIQRRATGPETFRTSLFLPSSNYVRAMTVGYEIIASDMFWIRAIQAFGGGGTRTQNIDQLEHYFNVITDLDPRHIEVYTFANMILGEEAGRHEKALAMIDKGIENNPHMYKLPYYGAFYAFWTMHDGERAKRYVRRALDWCPDAPDFLRTWVEYIDREMGRYDLAFEGYLRRHIAFYNEGKVIHQKTTFERLRGALDEWISAELRSAALAYQEIHGEYPYGQEGVRALEDEGYFINTVLPNWAYVNDTLMRYESRGEPIPAGEAFIEDLLANGKVRNWTRLPRNPQSVEASLLDEAGNPVYNGNPELSGYLVWPGQEPETVYTTYGTARTSVEPNDLFAISELKAAQRIVGEFVVVVDAIVFWQGEHGGECPPDLASVSDLMNLTVLEPWGGRFLLDREICQPVTTTFEGNLRKLYFDGPVK